MKASRSATPPVAGSRPIRLEQRHPERARLAERARRAPVHPRAAVASGQLLHRLALKPAHACMTSTASTCTRGSAPSCAGARRAATVRELHRRAAVIGGSRAGCPALRGPRPSVRRAPCRATHALSAGPAGPWRSAAAMRDAPCCVRPSVPLLPQLRARAGLEPKTHLESPVGPRAPRHRSTGDAPFSGTF